MVARSLDFPDQQRLVTAFVQIDGMRKRKTRDLYIEVLELELGYRLYFPRHDENLHDVWQLIGACLKTTGAIHTLVAVLETFHGGSKPMNAARDVVDELLPAPLLTPEERRDLRALALAVKERGSRAADATTLPAIYLRAVGPVGPVPTRDVRELQDVLAELEEVANGAAGVPPLAVFVAELADRADAATAAQLHDWVHRVGGRLGFALADLDRLRQLPAARVERGDTHLVVECRPDAAAPDRFLFTAWLQTGTGPGITLQRDDRSRPLTALPALLEELLTGHPMVVNRQDPDLTIEFVLPRDLLDRPFDQLAVPIEGMPRRLGIEYPVVLRSRDRMERRALHHNWRRKWDWLREHSPEAGMHTVAKPGETEHEQLYIKLSDNSVMVLVMAFPPWGGDPQPVDELWVGLQAGTPIIVFCRHGRDAERFCAEVTRLLGAELPGIPAVLDLPRRLLELRRRAAPGDPANPENDHLGLHLSVIFDDADRIPEPYLRLEPPT